MSFCRPFFAALGIGTIIGCSSSATLQPGKPVEQVAGIPDAKRQVQIVVAPAHGEPKQDYRRPVLTETKVCAVWVPEHLDEELDMKVGGHWLYFKVDKARWVMTGQDGRQVDEPNPPLTHGANASIPDVSNALKRGFESPNWLVPYRTEDETTERDQDLQREETRHENPR